MAKLNDRIEAELENIQQVLKQFPPASKLSSLSTLELAGVATLLHNYYNGIENVIKQIARAKGFSIPTGQNWHRDLLDLALTRSIINQTVGKSLKQYLAFRHFFSHAYAFYLESDRIVPLVKSAHNVFESFKRRIRKFLK